MTSVYECAPKSSDRLERELQMVVLPTTRCSCIAILWVSLVSFAAITLCVASQWVFIVLSVYFITDSVRKLMDTPLVQCVPTFNGQISGAHSTGHMTRRSPINNKIIAVIDFLLQITFTMCFRSVAIPRCNILYNCLVTETRGLWRT
jgi:hypothetical protein